MTKKIVLDSSVIFKRLNAENERWVDRALKLFLDGKKGKCEFYAPVLAKYEVGNVIWKRGLDVSKSKLLIEILFSTPITFIDIDEEMAKKAIEIALEEKITFYDASFIVLAENLNAGLVTDNPKHQKMALKTKIKIIPLENY